MPPRNTVHIRQMHKTEKVPKQLIHQYANSINALRRAKLGQTINPEIRDPKRDVHFVVIDPSKPSDRQIVGFTIARLLDHPEGVDFGDESHHSISRKYVDVIETFVHPDYQRRNLGSQMIDLVRDEAATRQATHVRVHRMHTPSVNLFLKIAGQSNKKGRKDRFWVRKPQNIIEWIQKRRPDGIIELHHGS